MLGFYDWPDPDSDRTWIFRATGDVATAWRKPSRGISLVWLWAMGSGGGGGGGYTGHGGGGGGGGGAGVMVTLLPAWACPDMLWLQVPQGGAGGNPGYGATDGDFALVCISPTMIGGTRLCRASGGGGGGGGNGGGGGGGGSGGSSGESSSQLYPYMAGLFNDPVSGGNGLSGQLNNGSPGSPAFANSSLTLGGAPGAGSNTGGTDYPGGPVTVPQAGFEPQVQTIPGGVAGGGNGSPGTFSFGPCYSVSGSGGGSYYAGTGGNGGNGGLGSGGGGAGSGGTSGGVGGRGGDGLIIITVA